MRGALTTPADPTGERAGDLPRGGSLVSPAQLVTSSSLGGAAFFGSRISFEAIPPCESQFGCRLTYSVSPDLPMRSQ